MDLYTGVYIERDGYDYHMNIHTYPYIFVYTHTHTHTHPHLIAEKTGSEKLYDFLKVIQEILLRGTCVAQLVRRPTLAQVMISWFVS